MVRTTFFENVNFGSNPKGNIGYLLKQDHKVVLMYYKFKSII
jgi:hypothetical protein